MRLSVNEDDAGNPAWNDLVRQGKWLGLEILLDGAPLADVLTADEEEGFAIILRRDRKGEPVRRGDEVLHLKVVGSVKIAIRDAE